MDPNEYETTVEDLERDLDVEVNSLLSKALNASTNGPSAQAAQAWEDLAIQFDRMAETSRRVAEGLR